jgi:hypothetical protein
MPPPEPHCHVKRDYRDRYEELTGRSLKTCPVCQAKCSSSKCFTPVESLPQSGIRHDLGQHFNSDLAARLAPPSGGTTIAWRYYMLPRNTSAFPPAAFQTSNLAIAVTQTSHQLPSHELFRPSTIGLAIQSP